MSSGTRLKGALCIIAIGTVLAACSSETAMSPGAPTSQALQSATEFRTPYHFLLRDSLPRVHTHLVGKEAPASAKRGIYVNEGNGTSIFGYLMPNQQNESPSCTAPYSVNSASDIAADNQGDVIVPNGAGEIIIGQGPSMCGPVAATINDGYGGGLYDASSSDALHGIIAVSTGPISLDTPGGIAICSVAYGCTNELTNSATFFPLGVAIDAKGNCWEDGVNSSMAGVTLTEFVGCSGGGVEASNFENKSFGGIEVDKSDNLVTFDAFGSDQYDGDVNVYKGCNPKCELISSTTLLNPGYFGHLDKRGNRLAVASNVAGQIDIYKYSPKGVKYLYSFNDGLQQYEDVIGVTYNKRSRE
jgi:hypothetical protein